MQVSTNGLTWTTLLTVAPSDDAAAIVADLSAWIGERIALRFVLRDAGPDAAWSIRDLRVDVDRRELVTRPHTR